MGTRGIPGKGPRDNKGFLKRQVWSTDIPTSLPALTLDSSVALPFGSASDLSVIVAADSAAALGLATQATVAIVVAADSSSRLPLGESAAIAVADALSDSEAVPLGTTATAQTLVALGSTAALPLATVAAGSLPLALDSSAPLPFVTTADMSGPLADLALDSAAALPLRTAAVLETPAQGSAGYGFPFRVSSSKPVFTQRRSLSSPPVFPPAEPEKQLVTLDSKRKLPLATRSTLTLAVIDVPAADLAAEQEERAARLGDTPAESIVDNEREVTRPAAPRALRSSQRLPLSGSAAIGVIGGVGSIGRLDLGTSASLEITDPPRVLAGTVVLPFRTRGTLSVDPIIVPPPPAEEDDDIEIIALAWQFMEAA